MGSQICSISSEQINKIKTHFECTGDDLETCMFEYKKRMQPDPVLRAKARVNFKAISKGSFGKEFTDDEFTQTLDRIKKTHFSGASDETKEHMAVGTMFGLTTANLDHLCAAVRMKSTDEALNPFYPLVSALEQCQPPEAEEEPEAETSTPEAELEPEVQEEATVVEDDTENFESAIIEDPTGPGTPARQRVRRGRRRRRAYWQ